MGLSNSLDKPLPSPQSINPRKKKSKSEAKPQSPLSIKVQVWGFVITSIIIASVIAWQALSWAWLIVFMVAGTAFVWWQASKIEQAQHQANKQKREAQLAKLLPFMTDLIQKRIIRHPNEQFRLYETPAGFRIIATHDTILPSDDIIAEWFAYFHADANYARLCQSQQCFRARLTAKPWRMSEVTEHKLDKQIPANHFWFAKDLDDADVDEMDEEQYDDFEKQQVDLAARQQWVADYDTFAKGYRVCRYIKSFDGRDSNPTQVAINEFIQWHDGACQADRDLPLA